ncbi:MAG: TIGR02186 family protein [Proteobacteria bacterium]|nr:TIGR02186 family protein [Pseudomonadota bacterium]
MKRRPIIAALCLTAGVMGVQMGEPRDAHAQSLVAALSDPLIEINLGFSGANLLLFGTADEGDVVVVVRGPLEDVVVRRKGRVGGIWINRKFVTFRGVPGYYAVSATTALAAIASPEVLAEHAIGAAHLVFEAAEDLTPGEMTAFHDALVRNMESEGLYRAEKGTIDVIGDTLFRTRIEFPAEAPAGAYRVDVHLFRDGELVESQMTPLFVAKSGIERAVFELANEQPALYGIIAIIIAVAGGWFAATVFRRI